MVFSKDGATASLDPHGAQKGSLTQDYVNFPTLKFGMFLPFLPSSPVTSVEATDHLSSECFNLTGRLKIHQESISAVGPPPVTRSGFFFILSRIKPRATVTYAFLSLLQSLCQSL